MTDTGYTVPSNYADSLKMTHAEFLRFFQKANHNELWSFTSMLRQEYEKRKTDAK